jgi:hypothetical protein
MPQPDPAITRDHMIDTLIWALFGIAALLVGLTLSGHLWGWGDLGVFGLGVLVTCVAAALINLATRRKGHT